MNNLIKKLAEKIESENSKFDYKAGKLEIANEIWGSYLTVSQRFDVRNSAIQGDLSGSIKDIRKCVAYIAGFLDA